MEREEAAQPKKEELQVKPLTWKEGFFGVLRWMGSLVRKFLVGTFMGFAITPFFDLLIWSMRTKAKG
jgi:hypothetical protein